MDVNLLLFEDFETLDIFGPIEILARVEDYQLRYYSLAGGIITNAQGVKVLTEPVSQADSRGILVLPGGRGTRPLVKDADFLLKLKNLAEHASFCLSICTGSALLGKCGVLEGKKATSNKKALDWVRSVNENVHWVEKARWVVDGKYYTSSGVSAGMDMALGFVRDQIGAEKAAEIAHHIEYIWNEEADEDPFARL